MAAPIQNAFRFVHKAKMSWPNKSAPWARFTLFFTESTKLDPLCWFWSSFPRCSLWSTDSLGSIVTGGPDWGWNPNFFNFNLNLPWFLVFFHVSTQIGCQVRKSIFFRTFTEDNMFALFPFYKPASCTSHLLLSFSDDCDVVHGRLSIRWTTIELLDWRWNRFDSPLFPYEPIVCNVTQFWWEYHQPLWSVNMMWHLLFQTHFLRSFNR